MKRPLLVAVIAADLLILAVLLDLPGALRDVQMSPPEVACPRLDIGPRQCEAVVAQAMALAKVDHADVMVVELGPVEERLTLGGPRIAQSRLHLVDGRTIDQEIGCGIGSDHVAWCTEDPVIQLWMGSNHDITCPVASEAAGPCGTPIVLEPVAVAAARPLRVDALDIPATVGHHEIELGRATLANGYLGDTSFALADPAPDGIIIPDGIRLEVRPIDPTRPPFNGVYERGVIPGVEEASAWLVFDVTGSLPGAVLQVRDVVVR